MGNKLTYHTQKWKNAIQSDNFIILPSALKRAISDFKLRTQKDVKKFILNGNLKKLTFKNSKVYENSNTEPKPLVDGYNFDYGQFGKGYFAFYFDENDIMTIKSLHLDDQSGNAIAFALLNRKELK